jgi:enolase 1/2/3
MTDTRIRSLHARQILDARGCPTVEVDVILADASFGRASVPSGASVGAAEAHELRDGDPAFYAGLGVLKAVANVNGELAAALRDFDASEQGVIDARLRELDGTPQLRRLGANATLPVSIAVCRAVASARGQELYERIGELTQTTRPTLPLPMTNILSGGLHAGRGMDIQDFLAIPLRAGSIDEAIHLMARVRRAATEVARERGLPTLLADEGGLGPGFATSRAALQMMAASIERAGLRPGEDIAIAIDVAASALRQPDGGYRLAREGRDVGRAGMMSMMEDWLTEFPVVSIEDGLDQEDWAGWKELSARFGGRLQLVGDDLFVTDPQRLARGIREGIANGVLIKANQNGTLTGTLEVIAQAKAAGYATIISARSGETEDVFMSDIAVGAAAGQIKIGSLRTSSTVAKYNQLLRIGARSGATFCGIGALAGRG